MSSELPPEPRHGSPPVPPRVLPPPAAPTLPPPPDLPLPPPELRLTTDAAADAPLSAGDTPQHPENSVLSRTTNGGIGRALRRNLGPAALFVAIIAIVLEIVAIVIGSGGDWVAATVLAWAVVALTVVAFVVGLASVIRGRSRRWGIAAIVLAVLGNPLVLVALFNAVGGGAVGADS